MLKAAASLAFLVTLVVGAIIGNVLTDTDTDTEPSAMPACTSDDGLPPDGSEVCYWDASNDGDRFGHSFVSLQSGDVIVYEDGTMVKPARR